MCGTEVDKTLHFSILGILVSTFIVAGPGYVYDTRTLFRFFTLDLDTSQRYDIDEQ